MKLNKGEWNELLVGLLCLKENDVPLYNSQKKLSITGISYGEDDFTTQGPHLLTDVQKLSTLIHSHRATFTVHPEILERYKFKKGSSKQKQDIWLKYMFESQDHIDGFGIKSLTLRPSLLNASRATNFKFKVHNPLPELFSFKAKKLLQKIEDQNLLFVNCESHTFSKNLSMIDTCLETFLAELLVSYFKGTTTRVSDLVDLTFAKKDNYKAVQKRIKDFLYYMCVGMFPSVDWNGEEQIIGTLIYNQNQDLICLHRFDINNFKNYLYEHSFLDTASTSRHKFGSLYKEGEDVFVKLNLLIRLKDYA
ncbi:MAG: HpaII family restriction endonuclease [Bdellovibrionaceae bacterium]|nr:HpaII family restriction endonuclease [Pseudobdellovibrionaceae bacterium]